MRISRLRFKYALRQCRSSEEMMRADALALSLRNKDFTSFWKDVSKMANSKVPLASKVGDSVGSVEITDMRQTRFSDLLNSVHNIDSKNFVCELIDAVPHDSNITITADDIPNSLKKSKSAGIDGLAAEHFTYSHKLGSFIIVIFMYANAWMYARCVYGNITYSYFEKRK